MDLITMTLVLTGSIDIMMIQNYQDIVWVTANQYRLNNLDVLALILVESGGNPNAVSSIGAVGLLQVMPREHGFPDRPTIRDLYDPETNIKAGCKILANYLEGSGGNIREAIKAYTGGNSWNDKDFRRFMVWFNYERNRLILYGIKDNKAHIAGNNYGKTLAYYGLSVSWDRHRNDWPGPILKSDDDCPDSQWCQQ